MQAGEQVKVYDRENDLIKRIAADPAFGMDEQKAVRYARPQKICGKSPSANRRICGKGSP